MLRVKQSAVLSSVVAGATINTEEAGFLPGMEVLAFIGSPGAAFVGSAIVQTSEDGTTWGTATGAVAATDAGLDIQVITLKQKLRFNMTAFTSGSLQVTFVSEI